MIHLEPSKLEYLQIPLHNLELSSKYCFRAWALCRCNSAACRETVRTRQYSSASNAVVMWGGLFRLIKWIVVGWILVKYNHHSIAYGRTHGEESPRIIILTWDPDMHLTFPQPISSQNLAFHAFTPPSRMYALLAISLPAHSSALR